jgi:hypothetical protein
MQVPMAATPARTLLCFTLRKQAGAQHATVKKLAPNTEDTALISEAIATSLGPFLQGKRLDADVVLRHPPAETTDLEP